MIFHSLQEGGGGDGVISDVAVWTGILVILGLGCAAIRMV